MNANIIWPKWQVHCVLYSRIDYFWDDFWLKRIYFRKIRDKIGLRWGHKGKIEGGGVIVEDSNTNISTLVPWLRGSQSLMCNTMRHCHSSTLEDTNYEVEIEYLREREREDSQMNARFFPVIVLLLLEWSPFFVHLIIFVYSLNSSYNLSIISSFHSSVRWKTKRKDC